MFLLPWLIIKMINIVGIAIIILIVAIVSFVAGKEFIVIGVVTLVLGIPICCKVTIVLVVILY